MAMALVSGTGQLEVLLFPGVILIVEVASYSSFLEMMLRHKGIRVFPVTKNMETKVKIILANVCAFLSSLLMFMMIVFTIFATGKSFHWNRFLVVYSICYFVAMLLASFGGKYSTAVFVIVAIIFFTNITAFSWMNLTINQEMNEGVTIVAVLVCIIFGNVLSYKNMCRTYYVDPPQNLNLF